MIATLVNAAADAGDNVVYEGPNHATVVIRPLAIKRALANLIDNAIAYAGTVRVRLTPEHGWLVITVEDDGPGIPAAELQRVFEPFHRLEVSRNRATGGVGLGLAIARQAVAAECGTLVLENRHSGGLTARVRLPIIKPVQSFEHARPTGQRDVDQVSHGSGPGNRVAGERRRYAQVAPEISRGCRSPG